MKLRPAFAMLTVLWVLALAAILALAAQLTGRDAYDAGRNRVYATRAYWSASDCMARARTLIDGALQTTTDLTVQANVWRTLDAWVTGEPLLARSSCSVTMEAAGTLADINAVPDTILLALFAEAGYSGQAQAMLDAFRDWTDSDNVARPLGAEADWYQAQGRPSPRNGRLANIKELLRVRWFETAEPGLAQVLTTEPGRISLATAPLEVLAAVPGFSDDALERVAESRASGQPIADLATFAASLPPDAEQLMAENFDAVSRLVTVDPDAWIVRATGVAGRPAIATTIEYRLVRAGNRAQPVRRWVDP